MDELTGFEARLATALDRYAGPRRTVDGLAIAYAVRTPLEQHRGRLPRTSMPVAMRLIAVAAIVVLGAGAILFVAGQGPAPTTIVLPSASPAATPWAPPAGLVTQTIEPGVVHVLGDDAGHDLTAPGTLVTGVDIDPSGVWVSTMTGLDVDTPGDERLRLVLLGQPDALMPPMSLLPSSSGVTVAPASASPGPGTADQPRYLSFGYDGGVWLPAPVALPEGVTWTAATAEGPDGRLWAAWYDPDPRLASLAADGPWEGRIVLGRYASGSWTTHPVPDAVMNLLPRPWHGGGQQVYWANLALDGDGVAWLGLVAGKHGNPPGGLLRFSNGEWSLVDPIGDGAPRAAGRVATAPDGSVWVHLHGCVGEVELDPPGTGSPCAEVRDPYLAHLDGDDWTVYSTTDGVPMVGHPGGNFGSLAIGSDGTAWMSASCGPANAIQLRMYPCDDARKDDRVHAFDGQRWRSFLSAQHAAGLIEDMDVAPDGTVWVWSDDGGLFVIDPGPTGG